jgi:hypothetical protein
MVIEMFCGIAFFLTVKLEFKINFINTNTNKKQGKKNREGIWLVLKSFVG